MKKVKYKGKNRYNEFLSAAKIISKKISKIEGIVGILAIGGIGRGYCDVKTRGRFVCHIKLNFL